MRRRVAGRRCLELILLLSFGTSTLLPLSFHIMRTFVCAFLGLLALALTACSTVQSRIEEKQHVYNTLDPQTQARIREGLVDVGYTTDMVYMAMGAPSERRERVTEGSHETTWIYSAYYQEYEGSRMVGYRRHVYFDRVHRAYRVYYEPVHADLYSEQEEERTRIVFLDGRVTAIEQVKD